MAFIICVGCHGTRIMSICDNKYLDLDIPLEEKRDIVEQCKKWRDEFAGKDEWHFFDNIEMSILNHPCINKNMRKFQFAIGYLQGRAFSEEEERKFEDICTCVKQSINQSKQTDINRENEKEEIFEQWLTWSSDFADSSDSLYNDDKGIFMELDHLIGIETAWNTAFRIYSELNEGISYSELERGMAPHSWPKDISTNWGKNVLDTDIQYIDEYMKNRIRWDAYRYYKNYRKIVNDPRHRNNAVNELDRAWYECLLVLKPVRERREQIDEAERRKFIEERREYVKNRLEVGEIDFSDLSKIWGRYRKRLDINKKSGVRTKVSYIETDKLYQYARWYIIKNAEFPSCFFEVDFLVEWEYYKSMVYYYLINIEKVKEEEYLQYMIELKQIGSLAIREKMLSKFTYFKNWLVNPDLISEIVNLIDNCMLFSFGLLAYEMDIDMENWKSQEDDSEKDNEGDNLSYGREYFRRILNSKRDKNNRIIFIDNERVQAVFDRILDFEMDHQKP